MHENVGILAISKTLSFGGTRSGMRGDTGPSTL